MDQTETPPDALRTQVKEHDMKTTFKTLLTALISVTALGLGANAYADGRGGDRDGWRDHDRHEQRWDDRRDHRRDDRWDDRRHGHDDWRKHHHPHYVRNGVYFYAPPPVVYPGPVFYGPTVYRTPPRGSVIIDLPTIVFR
jgi:hypothetical protein